MQHLDTAEDGQVTGAVNVGGVVRIIRGFGIGVELHHVVGRGSGGCRMSCTDTISLIAGVKIMSKHFDADLGVMVALLPGDEVGEPPYFVPLPALSLTWRP